MAERPSMLSTTSQAAIRTDVLDSHVKQNAYPALWEKSYLCPCRNPATRQPDQSCGLCNGRGVAYMAPKPVDIMIQSQEKGVFNSDLGLFDSGTAIGTPDRSARISFRDRITLPGAHVSQSFIFDVTSRRVEHGFYMVYDVKEIEFATTIDGEIFEGADYTVDFKKNRFYPKKHLIGKNVSINILTTLRYMVADLLKEHRFARDTQGRIVFLPQKLLLKREDIFVDKEAFSIGVDNEEVAEMVDTKRPPSLDGLNGFFRGVGYDG